MDRPEVNRRMHKQNIIADMKWKRMYKLRILPLFLCALLIGCGQSADKHVELMEEFSKIEILESATPVSRTSSYEIWQAIYGGTYNSDQSFSSIREHCTSQLENNGWVLETSKKIYDWDEDLGGRCVSFLKDDKSAVLQYAGEQAEYGWDYSFTLAWGLDGC